MKIGLGSFDAAYPQTGRHIKPYVATHPAATIEDTYREVLAMMATARIVCPYPPGSNFRENALIVSPGHPVRWHVFLDGHVWMMEIWVLDKPVAEGWVMRENNMRSVNEGPMSRQEKRDLLNSLTPDDTAWVYTYKLDERLTEKLQEQIFGGSVQAHQVRQAEWLSSVMAALLFAPSGDSSKYILSKDDVPECPPPPTKRRLPPGKLEQQVRATRRVWQRR
jgi:hypothetical protein